MRRLDVLDLKPLGEVIDPRGLPVYRQLSGADPLGCGKPVESQRSATLVPRYGSRRSGHAFGVPYCAVGCAQEGYVKDEQVIQIEGNRGTWSP